MGASAERYRVRYGFEREPSAGSSTRTTSRSGCDGALQITFSHLTAQTMPRALGSNRALRITPVCARDHSEGNKLDAVMRMGDLIVDKRCQVFVVDDLLAVGEILETGESVLEGVFAKLVRAP